VSVREITQGGTVEWFLEDRPKSFSSGSSGPMIGKRRCRMHGSQSTGPKTPEVNEWSRRAAMWHGRYISHRATVIVRDASCAPC
jgi:hypothetical protein